VADRVRPYLFYDVAVSVEGKIVFENGSVFMLKRCPAHGFERVLMADDVEYYRRCREVFIKPPEMPLVFNTPVRWGCPYDCGLCADHQQHSCLSLVEITDRCNLECPICYAGSGPSRHQYRTLDHVQRLIDAVVRNEGQPDVVQISGGEPTVHPDFFAILDRAKKAPIRHLMVNTNGLAGGGAAPDAAWRRSPRSPYPCPRAPEPARHLDDAGGHAEKGTERR
jgi:uncharacterized radical SAM superfamily Fe-S cluster-containing enzyme